MNRPLLFALVLLSVPALCSAKPTWADPVKATAENPDFSIQGEYDSAEKGNPRGLQVVALGNGTFDGYLLEAGLPGGGWERGKKRTKLSGKTVDGSTTLTSGDGDVTAILKGGKAEITQAGKRIGSLVRIERESRTLGAKPPKDAVVLFDGSSAEHFKDGKLDGDLLECNNIFSKRHFNSYTMHIEFRIPFKPFTRGQGRGNSGVYHQGRYETQILDSFGLEGAMNETGGIYGIAAPRLNMCYPPLRWQTYDADFTTAEYVDGKKTKNARMTVRLNGVVIHDNQELGHSTTASPIKERDEPGPLFLQAHGSPVRFRNIWFVEK
jgi:hypothetical protein